eukprot:scaffold321291_cov26-Tisochrysis_lutea.AAC.3
MWVNGAGRQDGGALATSAQALVEPRLDPSNEALHPSEFGVRLLEDRLELRHIGERHLSRQAVAHLGAGGSLRNCLSAGEQALADDLDAHAFTALLHVNIVAHVGESVQQRRLGQPNAVETDARIVEVVGGRLRSHILNLNAGQERAAARLAQA